MRELLATPKKQNIESLFQVHILCTKNTMRFLNNRSHLRGHKPPLSSFWLLLLLFMVFSLVSQVSSAPAAVEAQPTARAAEPADSNGIFIHSFPKLIR